MKFLLLTALVAVAAAAPEFVVPIAGGPAPVIIDGFEPVAIGPALIDGFEPVAIGPAMIEDLPAPATSPLVQIILNINAPSSAVPPVSEISGAEADPVQVVDSPPEPVQVVDVIPVPIEPVIIATPEFPTPVVVPIDELN